MGELILWWAAEWTTTLLVVGWWLITHCETVIFCSVQLAIFALVSVLVSWNFSFTIIFLPDCISFFLVFLLYSKTWDVKLVRCTPFLDLFFSRSLATLSRKTFFCNSSVFGFDFFLLLFWCYCVTLAWWTGDFTHS